MSIRAFVMSLLFVAVTVVPSAAQDESADLADLTCKQVMIMSGLDRDTTIAFIHGYLTHKRGDSTVDLEALETANEIFLNECLDNPAQKAIATMEAAFNT